MKTETVAIIGFGQEGVCAANYFRGARILIYDDKPRQDIDPLLFKKLKTQVTFYFKKAIDTKVDLIIRSPGVKPDHPQIESLLHEGAKQTTPTKIFFQKCPAKIIGVTGTKGKGTTATLIYEMLKKQYKDIFLAGNIGIPMLQILPEITRESLVVLELSSFQLVDLKASPHVAVVLMITTEHLDWHTSTDEYRQAKLSIVKYQKAGDFAVINQDFAVSKNYATSTKAKVYYFSTKSDANGTFIKNSYLISRIGGEQEVCNVHDILLPGAHNLQNAIAAVSVVKILGVKNQNIVKVLRTFKGLKHRLQLVKVINGIKYYNDSFSTTPETTIAAIEAFKSPKILILGGSSKKSDFSIMGQKIKRDKSIKAVILIGDEAPRIRKAISGFSGSTIGGAENMTQIVKSAAQISQTGDVVILSPACASFGMFKNYEDRGEQFIQEVNKLYE
ncbi:UDP-N-acetylmuramoylalanine--D-glutamate ligase [Candidatus Curtissbacteria bacterium RIFCSPLOWO2_01_FULL_42_26]|uniref:UDP-N-acetylmuramoylalanine--D-glutamate ligase n=1 Tax=Candidatus Curtissbacteria bacterium RIFCSPLOWO2_01_FULL_42_26 TaxID=1797729 RepID=A0A1F5I434_9BACT|nr:MAG: UDP-N-acetylmuramoylalanine--D-glutamate ligase [Candidatus Curtissbacteria bacterium RIFCSPLOWO2_01_FULL_42_26]